jgi:hypothetical protein
MSATNILQRSLLLCYAFTLFLLPWSWFPPFPWLHAHAQWSDIAFAATFILWLLEKIRARKWPRPQPVHAAMALYLIAATLSLIFASPNRLLGAAKLLGIFELVALALVTSDLVSQPDVSRLATRAIICTSLLTALAAITGLALFYTGTMTRLIGSYGDLAPSSWYARVEAGTTNPNMLASFCIFASAVVARAGKDLSPRLRRLAQAALFITVLLTFSRAILAFMLAAAIRLAAGKKQRVATGIAVIGYVALIAALTIWNVSVNPARPLETRIKTEEPTARLVAFTSSSRTLAAHPLFGSGVGRSPGLRNGQPFDAHMTLLNVAATMGLPALVAFVGIFATLWRKRTRPLDRARLAVWSGLAGLMLDGLAQDVEDFRHLWVMIGLAGTSDDARHNHHQD